MLGILFLFRKCYSRRIQDLITTDTPAVSTETERWALKRRQKWNGEIKHYWYMSTVYNSRHINCGVSKPRSEVCTKCFTS